MAKRTGRTPIGKFKGFVLASKPRPAKTSRDWTVCGSSLPHPKVGEQYAS